MANAKENAQPKAKKGPLPGTVIVKVNSREDLKPYEENGTLVGYDPKKNEAIIKQ